MKLYATNRAPNPDRVVYFARAKGIIDMLEIIEISIMEGQHKTPEFREISPLSEVPALVLEDNMVITESRAICTYLEGLYPTPNLLGETPLEKAQFEMWERKIELRGFGTMAGWFRHGSPLMAELESPQSADYAASSEQKLKAFMVWLDRQLAGRDFVTNRFSNADIVLFILCNFCRMMRYKPHSELSNIGAHYSRIKEMGLAG